MCRGRGSPVLLREQRYLQHLHSKYQNRRIPRSFLGPQLSVHTCMPVLFLLKRPPTVCTNPECCLLCGGTASPSSPPFPLRDAGEPSDEKMPAQCHFCHCLCLCHYQTLNAVAVQKWVPTRGSRGRLAPQKECNPLHAARIWTLGWQDRRFLHASRKADTAARSQCIMGVFGSTLQEARSRPAPKLAALLFPSGVVGFLGLWSDPAVVSKILYGLDHMA